MNCASLIAAGRFVVVVDYPIYCRITDALTGSGKSVESDHATREEANAACPSSDGDLYYTVLPREIPVREVRVETIADDDIPF